MTAPAALPRQEETAARCRSQVQCCPAVAQLWPNMGSDGMLPEPSKHCHCSELARNPLPETASPGVVGWPAQAAAGLRRGRREQLECSLLHSVVLACADKALQKRDIDEGWVPTCVAP